MNVKTLILGAGPAGLGAGYQLVKSGQRSWKILEATKRVGGLSSSRLDKNGFTWDLGGHVLFSKSKFFNNLVAKSLGADLIKHQRNAFVRMNSCFIPFPLQNNIHRLPKKAMEESLAGLIKANKEQANKPNSFGDWIVQKFGEGLSKHFMIPYNNKVWDFPLNEMDYSWIGERVSLPEITEIKKSIKTGIDIKDWGTNASFIFPLYGGTGGLFKKIAEPFIGNIDFKQKVVAVDTKRKVVTCKDGRKISYKKLITSIPIDLLIKKVIKLPPEKVISASKLLEKNSGWMIGIGLKRKIKSGNRCWLYFPDPKVPFYRVTYFSHYSPNNAPAGCSSLLCEISTGKTRRLNGEEAVEQTITGLIKSGIIKEADRGNIVSVWRERLAHLYPIPSIDRNRSLKIIQDYLKPNGIFSVGRFGGWKYERGNMDHSFLAGKNAVSRSFRSLS